MSKETSLLSGPLRGRLVFKEAKSIVTDTIRMNVCVIKIFLKCQLASLMQFLNHKLLVALPICIVLSSFLTKRAVP